LIAIHPSTSFAVNFVSLLIIEVDGGQHADNRCDAVRDKWLVDHNYRVLRFWNNDVLGNMAGVLETIAAALAEAPLTRIADAIRPLPASAGLSRES